MPGQLESSAGWRTSGAMVALPWSLGRQRTDSVCSVHASPGPRMGTDPGTIAAVRHRSAHGCKCMADLR